MPASSAPAPYVRVERLDARLYAALALGVLVCLAAPLAAPAAKPAAPIVGGLLLFCLWHFDRVTLVVNADEFVVGYRWLRTRTKLADLERVEPDRLALLDLRAARRRGMALVYVARHGPGVFVRRRGGLPFVASTGAPDELFAALRARGAPAAALPPEGSA